jgi:hypothetical protein
MKYSLLLSLLLVIGCASGNCRQVQDAQAQQLAAGAPAVKPGDIPVTNTNAGANDKVKVYKYDGSLQCGMGKAIAAGDMQKELKGLTIYSANNKADGLMHIQQCGTPTGKANVYEIDKKDLAEAKKRGFKEWTFE